MLENILTTAVAMLLFSWLGTVIDLVCKNLILDIAGINLYEYIYLKMEWWVRSENAILIKNVKLNAKFFLP